MQLVYWLSGMLGLSLNLSLTVECWVQGNGWRGTDDVVIGLAYLPLSVSHAMVNASANHLQANSTRASLVFSYQQPPSSTVEATLENTIAVSSSFQSCIQ